MHSAMRGTASVSASEAPPCANAQEGMNAKAGPSARNSIIARCRIARVSHTAGEGAAEDRVPRVVLERAAVPDLLGEGIPRGDGAARASAAHRGASLRRVRGGHRVLPAPARRCDVAAESALSFASLF